jgi:hypothetical protein
MSSAKTKKVGSTIRIIFNFCGAGLLLWGFINGYWNPIPKPPESSEQLNEDLITEVRRLENVEQENLRLELSLAEIEQEHDQEVADLQGELDKITDDYTELDRLLTEVGSLVDSIQAGESRRDSKLEEATEIANKILEITTIKE